jgi:hypothetical protein
MTNSARRSVGLGSCLVALLSAAPAFADDAPSKESTKAACASGFEQSQLLRRDGKLRESRAELLKCAQNDCTRALREQCGVWLEEVERQTPSIIVQATLDGEDHPEVRVELDGELLTESTSGRSYDANPGVHKLRFTIAGMPPVDKTVVVREGEKLRIIEVPFLSAKPAATPAPAETKPAEPQPKPLPPPAPVQMERPVPAITYVFAGLAVAGGGAFAFFGLSGNKRLKQLEDECSPNCTKEDVQPVERYMLSANVSAAVGAVGLAGALVSYLVRPSKPVQTGALRGNVAVAPRGVATTLTLSF